MEISSLQTPLRVEAPDRAEQAREIAEMERDKE